MKRITESQIRSIVRQEIKNVLFEQDDKDQQPTKPLTNKIRILGGILAALAVATLPGHTGGGDGEAQAGGGRTIEQVLADAGLKPEFLNELANNYEIEDIEKLASLGKMEKELQKKINDEKAKGANADQELIKDLTAKQGRVFSAQNISPELASKIERSGSVILSYVTDLSDEQLDNLKDTEADQLKQIVQSKAFTKAVNPKELTTRMSSQFTNDLQTLFKAMQIKSAQQGYTFNVTNDPISDLRISLVQNYGDQLPESFTLLDGIEQADKDSTIDFDSSLLNQAYYTEKIVDEFNSQLQTVSKEEVKAKAVGATEEELAQTRGSVQENKINKIRQRLNELRGVYV